MDIEAARSADENAGLRRQLTSARRQLGHTVAALERARHAPRLPPQTIPSHRKRRPRDKVRVILGDTHGAKIHWPSARVALADIKALDPDEVILLGDHVDCGGFLAQHHVMGYVAETLTSYEEDIAQANSFLDALQEVAPRAKIDYLEGNHERRVETWAVTETMRHPKDADMLRKAFAPEFLLHLAKRGITYYKVSGFYDGLPVPGFIKRGKNYFTHGFSTSKHAADVVLAAVSGNVTFGHIHRHLAILGRRINSGVIGAWCPGCLCEDQPLWQHGKPTDWTRGIAVELVAPSLSFLHVNVPIIGAESQLASMFKL